MEYRVTSEAAVNDSFVLTGWVASSNEAKLTVKNERGLTVEAKTSFFPKFDVLDAFDGDIFENCGFSLSVPLTGERLSLIIEADGETERYVFKAKSSGKLKMYYQKGRFYFKKWGFKKSVIRAVNELYALTLDPFDYEKWLKRNPQPSSEEAKKLIEKVFLEHPEVIIVYADSDCGKKHHFKTDFNRDMLYATDYIGTDFISRGDGVAGSKKMSREEAYEYCLKTYEEFGEKAFYHIPKVLFHSKEEEQYDKTKLLSILNEHFKRIGLPAEAYLDTSDTQEGVFHTVYKWEGEPLVSVVIPNKDHTDDLDKCLGSFYRFNTYKNTEYIVVENNSTEEETFRYYDNLPARYPDMDVKVVKWPDVFNFSAICNFGVEHSKGEYILLQNNDTELTEKGVVEEMLGYCRRDDVGICGARLFYFDDTIQHAGVIAGLGGIAGECFRYFARGDGGYHNRIFMPQNYSCVTAASLMTKRSVYDEVGGLDPELIVAYNDIDYCLKVVKAGYKVVYDPFAMEYHYEYKSRGKEDNPEKLARYQREVYTFTTRWKEYIKKGDPFYNVNLTDKLQDFSLKQAELIKTKE